MTMATASVGIGLYIHIPFCEKICNYCNFNRGLLESDLRRRYLSALNQEIERQRQARKVDSVFFGGGTPSVLTPGEIDELLSRCRLAFDLDPAAEITLEMNPETASFERLEGYLSVGVNRLSLGVQSFRDSELKSLGRAHTAARAVEAFVISREAGFHNISVDLMGWLPGQTLSHWHESVKTLIGLEPDHASLYLLELYPNAPLRDEMAREGLMLAPDEIAAEMYHGSFDWLEVAGYQQYEISNVAKNGCKSRHNLKYWSDGSWLGLGCGSHSAIDDCRWRNVSDVGAYIERVNGGVSPVEDERLLSVEERVSETLFLGLRLFEGVDLSKLKRRYSVDVWDRWGSDLELCVEAGLLHRRSERLRLTRKGMLLSNEVMRVFV